MKRVCVVVAILFNAHPFFSNVNSFSLNQLIMESPESVSIQTQKFDVGEIINYKVITYKNTNSIEIYRVKNSKESQVVLSIDNFQWGTCQISQDGRKILFKVKHKGNPWFIFDSNAGSFRFLFEAGQRFMSDASLNNFTMSTRKTSTYGTDFKIHPYIEVFTIDNLDEREIIPWEIPYNEDCSINMYRSQTGPNTILLEYTDGEELFGEALFDLSSRKILILGDYSDTKPIPYRKHSNDETGDLIKFRL